MQLTFLGTSPANACPEPFCRCENCRKARALGGRSLRKRQAAIHLSAHRIIEHVHRLRSEGLLKESGRVFASHIAHEGNPVHPDLMAFASQHGYEVAYDGLRVAA